MSFCRWLGVAVSERGRGHCVQGLPCQDHSSVWLGASGAAVVVSDGAGSARMSKHGANSVVRVTDQVLREHMPWNNFVAIGHRIIDACRAEIAQQARELGCPIAELAATLAFVAVTKDEIFSGSLGDAVVAAFRGDRAEVLIAPERGEFANETLFVTSSDANKHFRIVKRPLEDYDGFAVMSDGAADSLYQRQTGALAPALKRVLSWLREHGTRRVHDAIVDRIMPLLVKRTQDDCSLAILRRVCASLDGVGSKTETLQMELLEVGNMRGLRNRLGVMDCCRRGLNDDEVCRVTGLTLNTVRRHKRALSLLSGLAV